MHKLNEMSLAKIYGKCGIGVIPISFLRMQESDILTWGDSQHPQE